MAFEMQKKCKQQMNTTSNQEIKTQLIINNAIHVAKKVAAT